MARPDLRRLLALLLLPPLAIGAASALSGASVWGAAMVGGLAALASAAVVALGLRPLVARQPGSTTAPEEQAALASRVAEQARRLETLGATLEGMSDGLWLTDPDGTVTFTNPALGALLGEGPELAGRRPLEVVRSQALHAAVMSACERGEASSLELTVIGQRPRTLAVRISPLGRGLGGSMAVFHDVTELRRLESVRKDFVANVSHELRTPITAIRGYAETLRGGALSDGKTAAQMVAVIHRQSERLSELVEDLLDLSRLESKAAQLASEPVELAATARQAAEAVRQKAEAKRIALELRLPEGMRALGDGRAIEQVLRNLLDNAVKYTPEGGRVEVSGEPEAARCRLSVRDTGLGIEAKHLPRIFERFYRVDKGRSRELGGTGLGLAIVKHLVTAMGGEVEVQSQVGEGTTFTLHLPLPPAEDLDAE